MKPIASLSLDLDNKWSYLKTHGDPSWSSFPSYLDLVVPRILAFLEERNLRITFFIVGQDAALEANANALRAIAEAGHEIGNHSFNHEPWLHLYSEAEIDAEIEKAETYIERATSQRPIGFRGPGFSLSAEVLQVLERRGYSYDATVFPNLLNPLARAYFFRTSRLTPEEKRQRKALFGTFADALRPNAAFQWQLAERTLTEVPVTTMPLFKIPIHFSYVLYLSKYNSMLARSYFRMAISMFRLTRTEPSLLLHPLDFLGHDDTPDMAFFPAMDLPSQQKIALVDKTLDMLTKRFQIVPLGEHVRRIKEKSRPRLLEPRFSHGQ